MKTLFLSIYVSLLLFGCGSPDLDDPKTLDDIIAEAIDNDKLQERGKEGEELYYAPNMQTPYSGWSKELYKNGQVEKLIQLKDGQWDGLFKMWYKNGQVEVEVHFLGGMQNGLETAWFENGQKTGEWMFENNKLNGLVTKWFKNGQKKLEANFKDDKLVTSTGWKPNGEKCPITNMIDGNGVVVEYSEDGTEEELFRYKDGERVYD